MYLPHPVKVFASSGSKDLASEVCSKLQTRLPTHLQPESGISLGNAKVEWFSNQNPEAQIENVRGHFVTIIHTQTPPVSDNTIELFSILDAVMDSHPADVLIVFPYMPYSRSDRKNKPRISVMSKRFANIISQSFGVQHVLLLDPHDSHIKHYFEPAADEITAIHLVMDYVRTEIFRKYPPRECVLVFADGGSAARFERVPGWLDVRTAYIHKGRTGNDEHPHINQVVGDVAGKHCILLDDESLTGSTSVQDAEKLITEGRADSVTAILMHAPLDDKRTSSQAVVQRLAASPIEQIIMTDSIPVRHKVSGCDKFKVLTIAPLIAEAIRRVVQNESLTALHDPSNVQFYRS